MSKIYCPEDLILIILSRLPVKSLMRFRCVSKSWRLMIDSPSFIRTHIEQSKIAESSMKVVVGGQSVGVDMFYSDHFSSSKRKYIEELNYPIICKEPDSRNNDFWFLGSCNGLLCLVYETFEEDIVLWNPSTGKYRQLPKCSEQVGASKVVDIRSHGFGYDELNDDYKVFRLVNYYEDNSISEVFVYSLKSNEWRCLEDFPFKNDFCWLTFNGSLANGTLHWILDNDSILAFDVATERAQLLPLPETSFSDPTLCTIVFGGCQHLICVGWSSPGSEIWVMEDYATKGSWTKLTIDLAINRKMLLMISLELVNFPVKVKDPTACVYFESLVRLDTVGRNDCTLGDSRKPNKKGDVKSRRSQ